VPKLKATFGGRLALEDVPERARTVELPVCPVCGNIGKQPGNYTIAYRCRGPEGEIHKVIQMKWVRYEAVA
jgi:hypothetical protein